MSDVLQRFTPNRPSRIQKRASRVSEILGGRFGVIKFGVNVSGGILTMDIVLRLLVLMSTL